jgi:hypothetical protein
MVFLHCPFHIIAGGVVVHACYLRAAVGQKFVCWHS